MIIMGIDASLTGTGLYKIITDNNFKVIKEETITLKNKLDGVRRIIYIEEEIAKWVKDVDLVCIEGYAYSRAFRRESLAELVGVIKRRLYKMNKTYKIIRTQEVKKILTGEYKKPKKYKELKTKEWTLKLTKERLNKDFGNKDNECDAFGLCLIAYYLKMHELNIDLLKKKPFEYQLISSILNPKSKQKKTTLTQYTKRPYKLIVTKKDDRYELYCPAIDYEVKAQTAKGVVEKYKKGLKNHIKKMDRKKIKKAKKYYTGNIIFRTNKLN